MTKHTRFASFRRTRLLTGVVGLLGALSLLASACGASEPTVASVESAPAADQDTGAEVQPEAPAEAADTADESTEAVVDDADDSTDGPIAVDEPSGDLRVSQGTFDLVLANGESFSVPVGCALGSQISAEQEILYSATGSAEGVLVDVTVWGETTFDFGPSVEVSDSTTYDGLWRSVESSGLMIELNGNVITATGGFYQGEDLNGALVDGELTVSC